MARAVTQITRPDVMSTAESTRLEMIDSDPERYAATAFASIRETLMRRVAIAKRRAAISDCNARAWLFAASLEASGYAGSQIVPDFPYDRRSSLGLRVATRDGRDLPDIVIARRK